MPSSTLSRARDHDGQDTVLVATAESMPREADWRTVLAGVMLVSAVYVLWHLRRGWIAHDEGALGQSAERVLRGELPHRDFIDIYTGGLAHLNAAAFRLLGTSLWAMRLVLFALFLAWVPAVFYLASFFLGSVAAGSVTLLAVVWTLPTYPEPLPSWYNLFLATLGVAALFRHMESGRRRWLVVAGVLGGLSCLVKIVGLYYVAAVQLFLIFRANALARQAAGVELGQRSATYPVFVTVALALFVAALAVLVRHQLHASEVTQFILPGAMLSVLLGWNEWAHPAGDSRTRFATLAFLVMPFLLGLAMPVAIFLLPYVRAGAVGALIDGVFVLPTKRFAFAALPTMPVVWMATLLPVALLLALAARTRGRYRRPEAILLAITLPLLLFATGRNPLSYRIVWLAAFSLMPVLVVAGVFILAREREADVREPLLRQRTMLLLSVVALCSLIQFPFSVPIYLCYVAPLVVLAAVALNRYLPPAASRVPAAMLTFFLVFALFRTNTSEMTTFGNAFRPYGPVSPLLGARAGLTARTDDALTHNRVVAELRQHARGDYTWASPDAPQIYFLSGLRNPTRSLFEFFDDSTNGSQRVLRALDAHGVTAIVLNSQPTFSPAITPTMFAQLALRYPHARNIGIFQLRWRE